MLKGNNVAHRQIPVKGLKPTTINNTTADTAWINEPWKQGRKLVAIANGDIPASSVMTIKVLGKKRSDGSTVVLKDSGGSTDWQFTTTELNDGQTLEGGKGVY